ncbi:hypothetical protein FSARC_6123 [Fusarium sarcochroum]|uniref:Amidohydrolase 3 domain-containing protein n=1 Tax=Fusarium sarcochroum TaxID=1208366 RepID=A0A8H4TY89_9HYPO|nr:hypothetical protein FSARC_6123 [Fusarium sarcochroum]
MALNKFFYNGRILTRTDTECNGPVNLADSMLVQCEKITAIGSHLDIADSLKDLEVHDLKQRVVLPSFIDGHMHLLVLGQSLRKVDLTKCNNLDDIRSTIKVFATANPDVATIMCKGWMHFMTPEGVSAAMIDDIDPRPIFIDNSTLHSCWCNTTALKILDIDDMPDPAGGKIYRDTKGKPSGLLDEGAMMSVIWPFQARSSPKEERIAAIRDAVQAYNASGYTGLVEMAMDEEAWDALVTLNAEEPDLAIRIAAYWLIRLTEDLKENQRQVQRAGELRREFNSTTSPNLRLVGVKLICDGIIDACTAYLSQPYSPLPACCPPPIWGRDYLEPVVKEVDALGLQIALHAIGDAAIKMAIDVLERYGTPGRRHRIEHLELASPRDAQRLGELGLTASIQPVHADPSILQDWPKLLGTDRCDRAFAYREFADAGALMALGSDSPTSPWLPLHNLYVATTRQSSRKPGYGKPVNKHFRLGLFEAIVAATEGAARSVFEDRTGILSVGKLADFVVVDMSLDPAKLLEARVKETWFEGRQVWSGEKEEVTDVA